MENFNLMCTWILNVALYKLPKIVEAKQVENIFKNANIFESKKDISE